MKTESETWTLDADSLIKQLPLEPDERKIAKARATDLIAAIAASQPSARRETNAPAESMSAGAPLYISSLKLHLNVTEAAKAAVIGAVSLLVKNMALSKDGLAELSQPLAATALGAALGQFTRLTDEQRTILDAICRLKRERKLPGYAPTTKELATALGKKPAAIESELKPLVGKALAHDAKAKTWKIVF